MMKKIAIIGAGFAGLNAARKLSRAGLKAQITLFDRKEKFNFLPLLPDCIGRRIKPQFLVYELADFCRRFKIKFIQQEVTALDLANRQVVAGPDLYSYDYLLVSSGSQPNFFSNSDAQSYSFSLNNVTDIQKLILRLEESDPENLVICGGGYTGVEVASNLARLFKKQGLVKRIAVVERLPVVLGMLPGWMQDYVVKNLTSLGIEILTDSVIERIEQDKVWVSGNRSFERAMLIWVAGVKTADFIQKLEIPRNPQGRVMVDDYLRAGQNCFWAGDAVLFNWRGASLRMAVQFAITQGELAAENIIRSFKSLPLKKYRPRDLGYIIPLANNLSCGNILGLNVSGVLATFLHFSMCIYRSLGWKNKAGILGSLIKG
jgi:NADH:ubiquinone reductase (H+-translocating)